MGSVRHLPRTFSSSQQQRMCWNLASWSSEQVNHSHSRLSSSQGKLQSPQAPLKMPALPVPVPLQSLDLSPSEKAPLGPLISLPPLPAELSQPPSAYYEAWL